MKIVDNFLIQEISDELREKGEKILQTYRDGYFDRGIGILCQYLYGSGKEECKRNCEGEEPVMSCRYSCYIEVCNNIVNTLQNTVGPVVDEIQSEEQRERQRRILDGKIEKFTQKAREFQDKADAYEE